MSERDFLAERFEPHRPHLRRRGLPDARTLEREPRTSSSRPGFGSAEPTTALDRQPRRLPDHGRRKALPRPAPRPRARREESTTPRLPDPIVEVDPAVDPEQEALLPDSVGLALLIVLDTLSPPERLAFVLHDMFALPFEQIAPIVDRSPDAHPPARQPGPPSRPAAPDLSRRRPRRAASGHRCLPRRLARAVTSSASSPCSIPTSSFAPTHALPRPAPGELRGADGRLARVAVFRARDAREPALVNGIPGFSVAPERQLFALGRSSSPAGDHRDRHRRRPGQAGADRSRLARSPTTGRRAPGRRSARAQAASSSAAAAKAVSTGTTSGSTRTGRADREHGHDGAGEQDPRADQQGAVVAVDELGGVGRAALRRRVTLVATRVPMIAIPSDPPTWRMQLITAEPTPALSIGTEPIAAAVVGAIVIAIPSPPTIRPGRMFQKVELSSSVPKRSSDTVRSVMPRAHQPARPDPVGELPRHRGDEHDQDASSAGTSRRSGSRCSRGCSG